MKGARINFGVPNSEYVLLANDNGEATSLKNQDTGTEYIGGTSDLTLCHVTINNIAEPPAVVNIDLPNVGIIDDELFSLGEGLVEEFPSTLDVILYQGKTFVSIPNEVTISGNIANIEDTSEYIITGDCSITFNIEE